MTFSIPTQAAAAACLVVAGRSVASSRALASSRAAAAASGDEQQHRAQCAAFARDLAALHALEQSAKSCANKLRNLCSGVLPVGAVGAERTFAAGALSPDRAQASLGRCVEMLRSAVFPHYPVPALGGVFTPALSVLREAPSLSAAVGGKDIRSQLVELMEQRWRGASQADQWGADGGAAAAALFVGLAALRSASQFAMTLNSVRRKAKLRSDPLPAAGPLCAAVDRGRSGSPGGCASAIADFVEANCAGAAPPLLLVPVPAPGGWALGALEAAAGAALQGISLAPEAFVACPSEWLWILDCGLISAGSRSLPQARGKETKDQPRVVDDKNFEAVRVHPPARLLPPALRGGDHRVNDCRILFPGGVSSWPSVSSRSLCIPTAAGCESPLAGGQELGDRHPPPRAGRRPARRRGRAGPS